MLYVFSDTSGRYHKNFCTCKCSYSCTLLQNACIHCTLCKYKCTQIILLPLIHMWKSLVGTQLRKHTSKIILHCYTNSHMCSTKYCNSKYGTALLSGLVSEWCYSVGHAYSFSVGHAYSFLTPTIQYYHSGKDVHCDHYCPLYSKVNYYL